jgi:hypothetical protein
MLFSNNEIAAIITPVIDPAVGTGAQIADLFAITVPADDGCIDSPVDSDGFQVFV